MTAPAVTVLDNGLRVVSALMPGLETAAVGVWVNAGARCEAAATNGIAHLLEHMAFKGTKRRNALAIAEEIEQVGGHVNAYTSRECTAYVARVLKENVPLAVDILADILQHSVMPEDELGREREVVIQEIAQVHDTPDDLVFDLFQETAFPDQSLGRSILGTEKTVAGISREMLIDHMARHYDAGRMVVVAAGHVDHEALVGHVAEAFAGLAARPADPVAPATYAGGDRRQEQPLEQVHLVLGLKGIAYDDPDFYAQQVLATALGGGMSSRLFQEVRENRGLAYSIYTFLSCYADSGLFGIYAGTGEGEAAQTLPLVCAEINRVCAEVGEEEVARSRTQLKASVLMSLESTSSRCEQLARQMIVFKRPLPIDEIIAKIEAVDPPAVLDVARRLFSGKPALAALGPLSNVESYEEMMARLGN